VIPRAEHMALSVDQLGSTLAALDGPTVEDRHNPSVSTCGDGSETDRNAAILSVGALGAGKTTLDQEPKH